MGSRIILCVGGGIAAYKAPELVRALVGSGHEVQVITTEAASAFVTELSLATVSGRPVRSTLLDAAEEGRVGHIELADWADLVLVAPATANLMARAANGLANDLVTTVLLATQAPVLWVPAMNTNMWRHAATRENVATLRARGGSILGPDVGSLACGWVGEGRMVDPEKIVEELPSLLSKSPASKADGDWKGRHVLVSAGPTRAYLDPVRFISNASTGAMGFELAEAALRAGAAVTLVAGPVERACSPAIRRIDVETGEEMFDALNGCLEERPADLVAMVAAVADLLPEKSASAKLGKGEMPGQLASMRWREERDLLADLVKAYADRTTFLGFAAQTVEAGAPKEVEARLLELGEAKMRRKGCQALFVNRVGVPETGFASPTNAGYLLRRAETGDGIESLTSGGPAPKRALAEWILREMKPAVSTDEGQGRESDG